MNKIREWISDNLRYILLGLALILVLVIAVIGIRAISNIANGEGIGFSLGKQTEAQTSAPGAVIVETEAVPQASAALTRDDARVLTTMQAYYNARTNKDTETLRKLDPSMSELDEKRLESSYVESYNNISTYSKAGLSDGSYVVYVCYDGKVRDIDTMVPSLYAFYLKTDESGSLYIADTEGDAQVEAFLEESRQSAEVKDLIASVQTSLQEARNADPSLDQFMRQQEEGTTQGTTAEEGSSEQQTEEPVADEAATGTVVAIDSCNVRTEPNTDTSDNIIGSLEPGDTATKTGDTGDGWTIIDYDGVTAYVSSEFVTMQE